MSIVYGKTYDRDLSYGHPWKLLNPEFISDN